uniref:helix-turn-helix domain-containing protein n=1 Tax=Gordonia sp. MMO-8 TaxID=3127886 RepID=UPI003017B488
MTTAHPESSVDGAYLREWMPTAASFGTRLAMIRQGMGWNVSEAAVACGVTPTTWRKWEFGGSKPRDFMHVTRGIAEATGVSVEWLVFGNDFRINEPLPSEPMVRVHENSGASYDVPLSSASPAVLCAIRDSNPEPAD